MIGARARKTFDEAARERQEWQKRKPKSVPESVPEQKAGARDQAGEEKGRQELVQYLTLDAFLPEPYGKICEKAKSLATATADKVDVRW